MAMGRWRGGEHMQKRGAGEVHRLSFTQPDVPTRYVFTQAREQYALSFSLTRNRPDWNSLDKHPSHSVFIPCREFNTSFISDTCVSP